MGCNFRYDSSLQMKFTIPQSGHHKDFEIFYLPEHGQQTSVVRCEWLDGYECSTESGFNIKETDDKYALITLPDSLKQNPGKFHWQISGLPRNNLFCSWIPKVADSISSGDFGRVHQDDNTSINIAAAVGVVGLICLILAISIFLIRRHRKNTTGLRNANKSEIKDTTNGFIKEKELFLENKEDSWSQIKSEQMHKPKQGNICVVDIKERNSDKDFDDKNSDEESTAMKRLRIIAVLENMRRKRARIAAIGKSQLLAMN